MVQTHEAKHNMLLLAHCIQFYEEDNSLESAYSCCAILNDVAVLRMMAIDNTSYNLNRPY